LPLRRADFLCRFHLRSFDTGVGYLPASRLEDAGSRR
jgi:hypothetical protein